eukprot:gene32298-16866_t
MAGIFGMCFGGAENHPDQQKQAKRGDLSSKKALQIITSVPGAGVELPCIVETSGSLDTAHGYITAPASDPPQNIMCESRIMAQLELREQQVMKKHTKPPRTASSPLSSPTEMNRQSLALESMGSRMVVNASGDISVSCGSGAHSECMNIGSSGTSAIATPSVMDVHRLLSIT